MSKIMIQGTASSVGKSLITAALCRIFKQDGYSVCPYKSQNMSLNSYITLDGKEMGRAQVLQAYAAGLEPEAFMNPILLKPTSDMKCQIILNGKVYDNKTAQEYTDIKETFQEMLKNDFEKIEKNFDIVVMEGAGSPAEINLRSHDIVNMGMAELVDAPVLLVGDIDKGGVFAALAGTLLLLTPEERDRVKGTIINKFRGDINLLSPGLDMLYDIIKKPCLGVVPYFNLLLEDEDGAVAEIKKNKTAPIDAAVVMLPHISNFTDVDALKCEKDVSVRFITSREEFGEPDLLIIPGSKNTIDDLVTIRKAGLEKRIIDYSRKGILLGICGGYQMLGQRIKDPYHVETDKGEVEGMGLLPITTELETEKTMTRVKAVLNFNGVKGQVYGYEIHMGKSSSESVKPLATIVEKNGENVSEAEGAVNEKGNVIGTYIHGILDSPNLRNMLLNKIRKQKGMALEISPVYETVRDRELDKLADIVRESLDIKSIYAFMGIKR
ncbi:cobyric acid synthase [Clostridium oryzae]|uniref:Cobyric acid synthase n=1 Tax=Clostridium oryzae TaxID=1450648 RepID=A0A1V4IT31_9CLOT|nr:cobyric acid synthase [Clostridium oryzae]OPJ63059.1 cobyric acid synthase [Clostridium oryzae]